VTNNPAQYISVSITSIESFIVLGPSVKFTKVFSVYVMGSFLKSILSFN